MATETNEAGKPVWRFAETKRWNGKCKRCKTGHTALTVERIVTGFEITLRTEAGAVLTLDNGRCRVACACGARVVLERVRGKYVADKACNAKCLGATGHDCECSCGGKNHGAGACAH